mgnify:CR=1 FL=1
MVAPLFRVVARGGWKMYQPDTAGVGGSKQCRTDTGGEPTRGKVASATERTCVMQSPQEDGVCFAGNGHREVRQPTI